MDKIQEDISKLIEQHKFTIPFSNQTDSMDYPSMRKALEAMGYLKPLQNQTKENLHSQSFEVIQNKENFFVKGGTSKWHKNIVIPQISLKQGEKQCNQENKQGQYEVEMKCWAKKENGSFQEISLENNNSSKILGYNSSSTSASVSEQIVKFSSLKFSSTGYLESEISKSPSGQNNQASFSVLMEPFLPKSFDGLICEESQGITELKDFLSKASERHKIFHPLYLFGRFPDALDIYYKCSIKKQRMNKKGKDQIIDFQETLIEAFMNSEESIVILHFNTQGLEKESVKKLEQYLKPLKNKQIKLSFSESDLGRLKKDVTLAKLDKEKFLENYKKAYYELTKVLLNTRNKLNNFDSNFNLCQDSNIQKYEDIQKKSIKQTFEFNHDWTNKSNVQRIKARINNEYTSALDQVNSKISAKNCIDYNISSQSQSPFPKKTQNIIIQNQVKSAMRSPIDYENKIKTETIQKQQEEQNIIPCFSDIRSDRIDSYSNATVQPADNNGLMKSQELLMNSNQSNKYLMNMKLNDNTHQNNFDITQLLYPNNMYVNSNNNDSGIQQVIQNANISHQSQNQFNNNSNYYNQQNQQDDVVLQLLEFFKQNNSMNNNNNVGQLFSQTQNINNINNFNNQSSNFQSLINQNYQQKQLNDQIENLKLICSLYQQSMLLNK